MSGKFWIVAVASVAAREPDVGYVAAFLDGRVRKRQRALQIAAASERHRLGHAAIGLDLVDDLRIDPGQQLRHKPN